MKMLVKILSLESISEISLKRRVNDLSGVKNCRYRDVWAGSFVLTGFSVRCTVQLTKLGTFKVLSTHTYRVEWYSG